nr:Phage major tail protein 2 [uncultured Mediterranean phage uvMED]BAR29304.1 Phage major tail protein 2 [uncultured Mediterranean phage uvMED]BAR29323.1 Phage major tail protein 2 [uncultured Mediterranean phage uvMED]BAR29365.1 Phage major tail protein 2 [uncultured Mediterranean phage uvMED]BAR29406.1 Phage major tail protein 2 [uncultured Mediterranean phage uvMED]
MATHLGKEGTVQVGSNAIGEIRGFSIDETIDTVEDTSMGDSSKSYLASIKDFSGSVDVLYDEADTNGQTALAVGSSVTLNFAPEGSDSGDVKLTGTAIVTGKSITSTFDGLVESTITVQGTGGLTTTTY